MSSTTPPPDDDQSGDAWRQQPPRETSGQSDPGGGLPDYGSMPTPPPIPEPPVGHPPEPPSTILAAVRLMYVGAGLSLLGTLFTFTARDSIRDQLAEANSSLTASELDSAVNIAIGVNVVIGLLAVGLWLWMAFANRRGQAWARIVATVLGGLNILFTLFSLVQTSGFGIVVNIASIALAAAILWLLYRRESSDYYSAVTAYSRS